MKYSHKAIDNQTKTLQLFQEETFELEPESRMGFLEHAETILIKM